MVFELALNCIERLADGDMEVVPLLARDDNDALWRIDEHMHAERPARPVMPRLAAQDNAARQDSFVEVGKAADAKPQVLHHVGHEGDFVRDDLKRPLLRLCGCRPFHDVGPCPDDANLVAVLQVIHRELTFVRIAQCLADPAREVDIGGGDLGLAVARVEGHHAILGVFQELQLGAHADDIEHLTEVVCEPWAAECREACRVVVANAAAGRAEDFAIGACGEWAEDPRLAGPRPPSFAVDQPTTAAGLARRRLPEKAVRVVACFGNDGVVAAPVDGQVRVLVGPRVGHRLSPLCRRPRRSAPAAGTCSGRLRNGGHRVVRQTLNDKEGRSLGLVP